MMISETPMIRLCKVRLKDDMRSLKELISRLAIFDHKEGLPLREILRS